MQAIRVSAAGIIFDQDKVLLVRYKDHKLNILVGPGGGVLPEEDGLSREVFEETGLHVNPGKMLLVEDLLATKYRVIKIWFLCSIVGGQISETEESKIEGITEVGWFAKDQLKNETVYPEILKSMDWREFIDRGFETRYLPLKKANF